MISMYSPETKPHPIQFPKTSIMIPSKKNDKTSAQYYNIHQTVDRFDPNMASSPPNPFVHTLKTRMDVYYLQNNNILTMGDTLPHEQRSRALSIGRK